MPQTDAAATDHARAKNRLAAASSDCTGRSKGDGPIRIISRHTASPRERMRAVYVGRGSALGNPFKVKPYGPHERGTTLWLYENHLRSLIGQKDRRTCDEMNRLFGLALRAPKSAGEPLLLECFCAPPGPASVQPCHASAIAEVLAEHLPPLIAGPMAQRNAP